jgi:hypothetical protein
VSGTAAERFRLVEVPVEIAAAAHATADDAVEAMRMIAHEAVTV